MTDNKVKFKRLKVRQRCHVCRGHGFGFEPGTYTTCDSACPKCKGKGWLPNAIEVVDD